LTLIISTKSEDDAIARVRLLVCLSAGVKELCSTIFHLG